MKHIPMFVFGTLREPAVRKRLDIDAADIQPAVLFGFRKEGLNIVEDKGRAVPGLYFLVNEEELERLDQYEGVESNLYHRFFVNVKIGEQWKRAYAYQLVN